MSGTPEAFRAVRELFDYLLRITIMDPVGHFRLSRVENGRENAFALGVRSQPILLLNGHFLRLLQSLQLDPVEDGPSKLRTYAAVYQYQIDREGEQWVFRYDYLREAEDPHPSSHLQLRANLLEHEHCLPEDRPFHKVHMPTGRITLEAVVRCLVEQFSIPTNEAPEIWRPILTESEMAFERIAHRHASGPAV
jgi:hypothetical protein